MKKVANIAIFLLFFLIFLIVFMPYQKLYKTAIDELAQKSKITLTYNIEKANLLDLDLNNIEIVLQNKTAKIDKCKIKFYPLGLLLNSKLAHITVQINNENAAFEINKNKDRYFISGTFKTDMLSEFLDSSMSSFLKGFNGSDRLYLDITYKKNGISINKLEMKGDFELVAKGFMKSGVLRLMGVVKIGKIKENFSI